MANIAAELRANEVRNACNRYIARVTLPDRQTVTTNAGKYKHFRDYFQDLFARELNLNTAHSGAYPADFYRLEAASCEDPNTESEICEDQKLDVRDKTPGLYFNHCPFLLLCWIYNNWTKQGTIAQRFTRTVIKLLRKNKT